MIGNIDWITMNITDYNNHTEKSDPMIKNQIITNLSNRKKDSKFYLIMMIFFDVLCLYSMMKYRMIDFLGQWL
jgi:hypothetical protein